MSLSSFPPALPSPPPPSSTAATGLGTAQHRHWSVQSRRPSHPYSDCSRKTSLRERPPRRMYLISLVSCVLLILLFVFLTLYLVWHEEGSGVGTRHGGGDLLAHQTVVVSERPSTGATCKPAKYTLSIHSRCPFYFLSFLIFNWPQVSDWERNIHWQPMPPMCVYLCCS